MSEVTKLAEEHWKYTGTVIEKALKVIIPNDNSYNLVLEVVLDLMKFLYIEAFRHGDKHAREDRNVDD